ncbi:MAG: hypothetical protein ACK6DU_12100, partial [Planctomycetota bacterium]
MAKAKRPKAKKSDQPLEEDLSAENLETTFAVSDSKITVRRDGGKVVVSVPVRFYRRNGRQMILADSIESDSIEAAVPNNALLTALPTPYPWQEQPHTGQGAARAAIAQDPGDHPSYGGRTLHLPSLAPD